ncbi:hypothetical protein BCF74_11863 [Knoellia remsis]|uniref:PknH-like protein n=1 Tax=Knoellia remsis TaxID=407159 RepID=A0A2T0UFN4_9MICO|nr:hypothetical protein [Knoellia remsis]PRY56668.1 hypothetical protein BCF74_11863 [Knoellia remsis]
MSRYTRILSTALVSGAVLVGASTQAVAARPAPTIPDVAPETMAGQPLQWDLGNYPLTPTVSGAQVCDPANEGATATLMGRQWTYYDGSNDLDQLSADLTVTLWKNARNALQDVATDGGVCSLIEGWAPTTWEGTNPRTHLLLTDGDSYAAVVAQGKYVVSVVIRDWSGDAATPEEAREAAIAGVEDTLDNF